MITLNLLPDIKKEFLKAQRFRNKIIFTATTVIVASVGIILLSYVAIFAQTRLIKGNETRIEELSSEISGQTDIEKVLTIRDQLGAVTELHTTKPKADRLFEMLSVITPNEVNLTSVEFNFIEHEVEITGNTTSTKQMNVLVDTLKNTTLRMVQPSSDNAELQPVDAPAFSGVVTSPSITSEEVIFTVAMDYNAQLFENNLKVELIVPEIITTQSVTGRPSALFNGNPNIEEGNE